MFPFTSHYYFDVMFFHNLRERNKMVVRFPDKDPGEWELVRKFLDLGVV